MSHYKDYSYTTIEPGSEETARGLAPMFEALVRQIDGVESIRDLGCGSGYLVSHLARNGYRVTGVDASETGIDIAQRHCTVDTADFVCAEITPAIVRGSLIPESFDVVVSSDVIEHLYRPSLLIETAALLLKPGGTLVIGTPYHGYLKNLAISVLDMWDAHHGVDWDGGHIKFYSVKTLAKLLSSHGFKVKHFDFHGRLPWLWKNMICTAKLTRRPA